MEAVYTEQHTQLQARLDKITKEVKARTEKGKKPWPRMAPGPTPSWPPLATQMLPPAPHRVSWGPSAHRPTQLPRAPRTDPMTELTISNVPYQKDENLDIIMTEIATLKKLTLDPKTTYFRAINRTNILPQPNKPPKIIVRLTSNEQKRALRK